MTAYRFTVVHTDAAPNEDLSTETALFDAAGARLVRAGGPPEAALIEAVRDADALIVVRSLLTPRVAEALARCQVVARTGVGYDTLDVPALTAHGVMAVNLPDIWTDEVANQALALLLALNRRLLPLDRGVRAGKWRGFEQPHIGPITGETMGIVGYGRIGSAFARRCSALGMRILAYDPYRGESVDPTTGAAFVPSLDTLLAESDYVSLHCPLSTETRHLIGVEQLRRMRPAAFLINTARGSVVDEQALIAALQAGTIAGAGIDAFEQEPPDPASPLLKLENVVLSPHNAFFSDAAVARMHRRIAEEIIAVLNGGWPDNLLNPEVTSHAKHTHRKVHGQP